MKTISDIEFVSALNPAVDFCLRQIKAGNIDERDGLIEMIMHLGEEVGRLEEQLKTEQTTNQILQVRKNVHDLKNKPFPQYPDEQPHDPEKGKPHVEEFPDGTLILHSKNRSEEPMLGFQAMPNVDLGEIAEMEIPIPIDPPVPETPEKSERMKKLDDFYDGKPADRKITPYRPMDKKKRGWLW